jgi:secreted trypsin-like serine protease
MFSLEQALYLRMKNVFLISVLFLLSFSAFAQKVKVQLFKVDKAARTEWKVLDEQNMIVASGKDYVYDDSLIFSLDANKRYVMQISVSEIFIPDTIIYSLSINNEPIILIRSDSGPGEYSYPFYTGTRTKETKIVGGVSGVISDFPWQVYYISGNFRCGGSIINGKWVLTAAHCTKNDNGSAILASDMQVKVGTNNPYNAADGKLYQVSEVIVHEGFNSQTLENDIALLRIQDTIKFANAVPVKLITAADIAEGATNPGVMSWVTGWGLTNVSQNILPTSLQKVQLPLVSNLQASTVWGTIPSTDMMAGYLNGNKDACNGDSGGPLIVPVYGEYKLAGIVSWGSQNCNTYGAYTRVSLFDTWIRTKTGITKAYIPPSPVGDSIVCQGVASSQYSIANQSGASLYEWRLYPADAGIISGNTRNASVLWDISKTVTVAVMVRVSINNAVSDWSKLNVQIVKNTKLLSQSNDNTLCAGNPVSLSVVAEGLNLFYKWYQNDILVQSGTSGIISFSSSSVGNSGNYKCEISGSCGTIFSNPANLTVFPITKIFSISPDLLVPFGNDATLEVNADGHDLIYQWEKDNVPLINSNTSQFTLANVNATDIGLYKTIVSGTCGTSTSNIVYVYVQKANSSDNPEIYVWPTLTSSQFSVALSTNDSYNIQVVSQTGKLTRELTNCRYQTIINVETLTKGIYFIVVYNQNFRKSIKVIKV